MKKTTLLFLLLLFLLTACSPVSPQTLDVPVSEPVAPSQTPVAVVENVSQTNQETSQAQNNEEPKAEHLAAWMQTSILVVKWNAKTRQNEIVPVETTSAKVHPDAQPITVGEEFVHAFSPDSQTLALVSSRAVNPWDSVLRLVNVPTWTVRETSLSFSKWVEKLVFSPDGQYMLVVQWPPTKTYEPASFATLTLVNISSQTIVAEADIPYRPRLVAFAKEGLAILGTPITTEEGTLAELQAFLLNLKDFSTIWQTSLTGVMEGGTTRIEGEEYIHTFLVPGAAISEDGRFIYAVHANENRLTTIDFDRREFSTVDILPKLSWLDRLMALTAGIAHAKMSDGNFKEAALSPDGTRLYIVGTVDESYKDDKGEWHASSSAFGLQTIDLASKTEIAHISLDAAGIRGFSSDGTYLYLYSIKGDVIIVDTAHLEKVKTLEGYQFTSAQTLNGTSIGLSSRTSAGGKTTMSILDPSTLKMTVEWVEPGRTYFLEGQRLHVSQTTVKDLDESFKTCPVTLPTDPSFTPPAPFPAAAPYAGEFWHGTAALWTALPLDGKWAQLAYGEKVFWWREGFVGTDEPQPELSISARQLDAESPVVKFGPPATNAYHTDFDWAMLIGIQLPHAGCWEITGHYDSQKLSFVVWVGD